MPAPTADPFKPAEPWLRNYKAMLTPKLDQCIAELQTREGPAADRVRQHDGSIRANLTAALQARSIR